jgi:hypothetical protein
MKEVKDILNLKTIFIIIILILFLVFIWILWSIINSPFTHPRNIVKLSPHQGACLGVTLEINKVTSSKDYTHFKIQRKGGGTIIPPPTLKVIKDGVDTPCIWNPENPDWSKDLTSATCTFETNTTISVEAGLILDDGVICPNTGKWKK